MSESSLGEALETNSNILVQTALEQMLEADILPTDFITPVNKAIALIVAVRQLIDGNNQQDERLTKADSVTLSVEALKDGKLRIRGGSITDYVTIGRGQALVLTNRFGQVLVAKRG